MKSEHGAAKNFLNWSAYAQAKLSAQKCKQVP